MFVQLTKELLGKPAGERIDVADADADRLIRQGWAQPIEHDLLTPAVTRAVQSGLDDAVDRALHSWLARQTKPGRVPFAGLGDSVHDDPRAGFKHFGEFSIAVRDACQPGKRPDDRLAVWTKAASGMGEVAGADGGFLVPPEFVEKLLQRVYAKNNLLGMTDSYTIGANVIAFPRSSETSRANGSRWGGVRAFWRDEGEQNTATKATFSRLQLNLRKLFVMINANDLVRRTTVYQPLMDAKSDMYKIIRDLEMDDRRIPIGEDDEYHLGVDRIFREIRIAPERIDRKLLKFYKAVNSTSFDTVSTINNG